MVALIAKLKMRLWTSIREVMTTLNAETKNATWMALNTDTDEWWLWTLNEDAMMALNVKLGSDDGFEHRNQETR